MNRIGLALLFLTHTWFVNHPFTQPDYAIKADIGFLRFQYNTVQIDPGPDWMGYYLNGENGIDFNLSYGLNFKNRLFTGLGIGYLNFEGIDGFSVFSEFNYSPLITRFNPLINVRIGYSHIWNQYENGTGTVCKNGKGFTINEYNLK